jgi:hypothetical protein
VIDLYAKAGKRDYVTGESAITCKAGKRDYPMQENDSTTGEGDVKPTSHPPDEEKSTLVEYHQDNPIHELKDIAPAQTAETAEQWREIEAHGATAGETPLPRTNDAGVASPLLAKRGYKPQAARAICNALLRGAVVDLDRVVAGKAFEKNYPIERLVEYCEWAQATEKYKRNGKIPNAGWVWNDLDEWRGSKYPPLTIIEHAAPTADGYGYGRKLE